MKDKMIPLDAGERIRDYVRQQIENRRSMEELEKYCRSSEFAALPEKEKAKYLEELAHAYYRHAYRRPYMVADESEDTLGKAYAIWHELLEQPEEDSRVTEFRRRELAYLCAAFVEMYRVSGSRGSLAEAQRYAEEAVRNYGAEETYETGRVYRDLGACALQQQEPQKAAEYYRKAEACWRKDELAELPVMKRNIAELCSTIGKILGETGSREEKYEYLLEAYRILSELKLQANSGDPDVDNRHYWMEFGQSAFDLAEVLREFDQTEEAEQHYLIALAAYETACRRYEGAFGLADRIIRTREPLRQMYEEQGRMAEAEKYSTDERIVLREIRNLRKNVE